MAPKPNFRLSKARATLMAFIAALAVLVLLAAPASAQCQCSYGVISYSNGARCWYGGPGTGRYDVLPYNYRYNINCQRTGPTVGNNNWWNRLVYNGAYCYVSDYYMTTGCPTRCYNLPLCA
ncbi:hypothetical protein M758_8G034600 [Ceratodon purpureus]|nr:hypothetical protein M758_8G034600 [Ceratodon purpureus]